MKKVIRNFISALLAAVSSVTLTGPAYALIGDIITIEDRPEHMSFEVLTGDLTYDGKINSADLLALADDIFGGKKVRPVRLNFN